MKRIRVDASAIIWGVFIFYTNRALFIPLVLSIVLHELGHVFCALFIGAKIKRMHLSLHGAKIELEGNISYLQEILIALAGPFVGILASLLTFRSAALNEDIMTFCLASSALSIFNLLPLANFDGGRVAKCLLCSLFSLSTAEHVMEIISFFALFFFWLISVYFMIKFSGGVSGFIFCLIFFSKCFIFNKKRRDLRRF